uniref:NADH-ubiquinone oxidoreductase chain 6 n=1 Tax=Palinurellus wieneckii TaxID=198231 RepID=S4V2I1_PALWI|nr:NADH dehydrogenase subunit 6 [Palinurellus wieneckii]AGN95861.1 NADH dehydrogenase subunit 6 [Palinurellus wieneckii]
MLTFLLPYNFFLSLLFTRLSHPLSAGVTLLIQTTLVSLSSGLILTSFWFSYILFLIFLGGMLVLFIYVASLASNEAFKVSLTSLIFIFSTTLALSGIMMFLDPMITPRINAIANSLEVTKNHADLTSNFIYFIYNSPTTILTLFIILYLLLTLIVVVNVTSVFYGPLRFSK